MSTKGSKPDSRMFPETRLSLRETRPKDAQADLASRKSLRETLCVADWLLA